MASSASASATPDSRADTPQPHLNPLAAIEGHVEVPFDTTDTPMAADPEQSVLSPKPATDAVETEARVHADITMESEAPNTMAHAAHMEGSRENQEATSDRGPDSVSEQMEGTIAALLQGFKSALQQRTNTTVSLSGSLAVRIHGGVPRNLQISLGDDHEPSSELRVTAEKLPDSSAIPSDEPDDKTMPPPPTRITIPTHAPTIPIPLESNQNDDLQPRRKRRKLSTSSETPLDETLPLAESTKVADLTVGDLNRLLTTTRDDIQSDTIDSLNHVQRLLRRFYDSWRDSQQSGLASPVTSRRGRTASSTGPAPTSSDPATPQIASTPTADGNLGNKFEVPSIGDGNLPIVTFPQSESEDYPAGGASPADSENDEPETRRPALESRLLKEFSYISKQIKWVEECRRIATELHSKREETWRMSSATFHDTARRDREKFEKWMAKELARQGQTLATVMNEVKGLSNLTYSLKWETPATTSLMMGSPGVPGSSHSQHPYGVASHSTIGNTTPGTTQTPYGHPQAYQPYASIQTPATVAAGSKRRAT